MFKDANVLKNALEKYVNGEKCNSNVCPHVHDYVFAPGTLPGSPAPVAR